MNRTLICPKCKSPLTQTENTLKCGNNHCYDIAKQGYVNLVLGSSKGSGDDKAMCQSRHKFHSEDYYNCLSRRLSEICIQNNCKSVLDAGCGEGYYLRMLRDAYVNQDKSFHSLCGIDLAKEAVALGAKLEKQIPEEHRIEYAVAGIFDMPIADNSVDCLLSVFAPVPDKEAMRVLKKDGIMLVVSPGEKHLEGLKSAVYENIYDNETAQKDFEGFTLYNREYVGDTITVQGENIINLFHMTPYYWKTSEKDAEKLNSLSKLTTKIEFIISFYKKS
ncbi:MAG: methyltransferase domain-containing protein [Clostridia bacterium]|nr:methyltransferase domain-containing protein [Clostridia bacterium]